MADIRAKSKAPVAVGFGVRDAQTAKSIAGFADAVVIGSALVEKLAAAKTAQAAAEAAKEFLAPIRKALDEEFERYVRRHKAEFPNDTIGVGPQFDFQLFDRDQLYSVTTRFVLAGIVNRMDRAYVAPATCGEIRLIYRLAEIDAPPVGDHGASARLPMTFNLILKAKADNATDGKGAAATSAAL